MEDAAIEDQLGRSLQLNAPFRYVVTADHEPMPDGET
jgi:hypothetical protein